MNIKTLFSDKILSQIAFGQFDIQLNFHKGLTVMISSSLVLESENQIVWSPEAENVNIHKLLKFLNQKVLDAKFEETKGLQIRFKDDVFNVPKPTNNFEYLHILSEIEGVYIY